MSCKKNKRVKENNESNKSERYMLLLGENEGYFWWGRGDDKTTGIIGQVKFDANYVINQDEVYENVIGFYHTHPGMGASPSDRDHRTMKAWVCCLGKPLICIIKGCDGVRAWLYRDDESAPWECRQVKKFKSLFVGARVWNTDDDEHFLFEEEMFDDDDDVIEVEVPKLNKE